MSPGKTKDEVRIFTPVGQFGQGWNSSVFWNTIDAGVDAIIADAGSTDSGPGRLALGKTAASPQGYKRDFGELVKACHTHGVRCLIGSAGGSGTNAQVDMSVELIKEIVKENGYRPMKVISIYAEIPKETVRQKFKDNLMSPCGKAVPELKEEDIDSAIKIVAQMGLEPYLKAMNENPDFDIIIGGRSYDPAPYAAFCMHHGFEDLGINYAMGKIMECGAQCAIPKTRESLAIVRRDNFDLIPLQPEARCTPLSVAAHLLYEKSRPDILQGPGGELHTKDMTYEQVDERTVRVRGPKFIPQPEGEYTVKTEAARINGYQNSFVGAFRDPILISQLDTWLPAVKETVGARMSGNYPYETKIITYGINGVMGALEPDKSLPKEVCVVVQCKAPTQEQANEVANRTKMGLTHAPYPGQLATAGNFAWPITPCETPIGPVPEFCMYHLIHKADPVGLFPFKVDVFEGTNKFIDTREKVAVKADGVVANIKNPAATAGQPKTYYLKPAPAAGTCYLGDIASVVRSKIAGPYEVTFDIMFKEEEVYQRVKKANVLSGAAVAKLYNIPESDVVAALWWDPARAFKATIPRYRASAGFEETDTHGSQQHAPLLFLTLPWGRE
ncbi:uncharacterized protein Z520_02848 [Fonsecaea multimorphosa CBS 102226]|uniref:Uncharacterized protein n=1 Tax=Fonsecaea multimorphosa CBS 102226 TaxID=1442371 RepID=A0A0D2HHA9_9EURO|nr:uncharacterized protein Z520_02848 [Fonsecaea multimorphosa CBS 102226]KIY01296.1 hypothetical protein Z520_02848 [Fonsecaea multimorphosa CBS 102226]OAL28573.1 hypothetical protein AYO22_02767 [Fonsecaea multimorphosa]